jgi:hypothetical protein
MHRKTLSFAFLVLALLVPLGVYADAAITAQLVTPEGEITVGDSIPLILEVTHPEAAVVLWPDLPPQWGDWAVVAQSPLETEGNGDGTATSRLSIDARLFAPGDFSTPPLSLSVGDSDGQLVEVKVAPASLTVQSVLVEGDTALRDIKPQAELPFARLWPWLLAAGLGALIAGAVLILKRRRGQLPTVADNRPPHQKALDQLAYIEQQRLPDKGRIKRHYTLISDCLRVYVEDTTEVPVMERTTREVGTELKATDLEPQHVGRLVGLLSACDLVKFARFDPGADRAYQAVDEAREFVQAAHQARAARLARAEQAAQAAATAREASSASRGHKLGSDASPTGQPSEVTA